MRSDRKKSAPVHGHDERLLDSLTLIVEAGKAKTTDDLVRYTRQAGAREAAERLKELAADGIPLDLAFEALKVHVRIVAYKRASSLIAACQGKRVTLVLPLPPHVSEAFGHLEGLEYVVPDGHHVPPYLEDLRERVKHGSRAGRALAPSQEVLVFEVFKEGDGWLVDGGVGDVVDVRILPATTRLIAHVRTQRHPNDVPLALGDRALAVL
jgi:hypothetical protein